MTLTIRFDDQSISYAHGVEFGRMLAKMESKMPVVSNGLFPVREENLNVLISACKEYGYEYSQTRSLVDGWIEFVATYRLIVN